MARTTAFNEHRVPLLAARDMITHMEDFRRKLREREDHRIVDRITKATTDAETQARAQYIARNVNSEFNAFKDSVAKVVLQANDVIGKQSDHFTNGTPGLSIAGRGVADVEATLAQPFAGMGKHSLSVNVGPRLYTPYPYPLPPNRRMEFEPVATDEHHGVRKILWQGERMAYTSDGLAIFLVEQLSEYYDEMVKLRNS